MERLYKLGGVPGGRAELMLEVLAALLEAREVKLAAEVEVKDKTTAEGKSDQKNPNLGPRGPIPSRPPWCGRTPFLEVHHIKPRHQGGSNCPENLVTLCASCHRLWHERIRVEVVGMLAEGQAGAPGKTPDKLRWNWIKFPLLVQKFANKFHFCADYGIIIRCQ